MRIAENKSAILQTLVGRRLTETSPFAGKPLSHTQTAVRGERCPNFREAA